MKEKLTTTPVLAFYDVNKEVTLSVDASRDGLGAVILQQGLPIEYASKALNKTQQNYAQIEKEALAIVFACERFHQYIVGKSVRIESDHKPLETIFAKPLSQCPARIQRMRLRLQVYDIKVQYKPGKELWIADALSRAFIKDGTHFKDQDIEASICLVKENLPMSAEKFNQFKIETSKDPQLQALIKQTMEGWTNSKKKLQK